jgi:hypothetical protein
MAQGLFTLRQQVQGIIQGAWSGYIAPKTVEYLVVAGGGGGGSEAGAGAGGLLQGIVPVTIGTSYTVTVGSGGTGGTSGGSGTSSVFGSISASGGGGTTSNGVGVAGGSGGGGATSTQPSTGGGQGTFGQGNAGGGGANNAFNAAGGGGGAGTAGLASSSGPTGGNGGAGIASAISGTITTYAGGGGGSGYTGTQGSGGVGGGGVGSNSSTATSGAANTGGGGGGSWSGTRGSGGSGIVIVRYLGNVQFYTGGTVNYTNGYIVHIFTSSGTLAPTTPTVYNTSYQISRSLRFNIPNSTYLTRTPASSGNQQTWTWSAWVKRGALGSTQGIFYQQLTASDTGFFAITFTSGDTLALGGWTTNWRITTQVFRDPSAWYHIVVAVDTTQATANNRVRVYVNGSEVTSFSTTANPTQNSTTGVNSTGAAYLGKDNNTYFGGFATEIYIIDGQQLTPSSFGTTSTTTGVWAPIQYTGTYGTNGFYLNFSDNSGTTATTLGKDYSGNNNNFTPNNFSVTAGIGNSSMVDSPTPYGFDTGVGGTVRGNYATWNPISKDSTITLSNGNLDYSSSTNADDAFGTMGLVSGKWYFEFTPTSIPTLVQIGVATNQNLVSDGWLSNSVSYRSDGQKYVNGSASAYGATFIANDVIGVAVDIDNNLITFYKNNVSQTAISYTFTGLTVFPVFRLGTTGGTGSSNFGQRAFAYTAPSGFQALCTQNLPTPIIGATSNTLAGQFFNTVLYTGNGTTQTVTGVGFQPDFIWAKSRSNAYYHTLVDSVRTRAYILSTNVTTADTGPEPADKEFVSFNADGFSLGPDYNLSVNTSGATFVAWNWKAGNNAGASNSAGSVTSTVSVNTRSGFSIVTYTTTGSVITVGHGLGVAPSMIIVKARGTTSDWFTYHSAMGATQGIYLNQTLAAITSANFWNNTAPTSTVFTNGTGVVASPGNTAVAYCFAPVAGYSAFGSWTGNGSADGPFIYMGFRPRWIMIKGTNSNGYIWTIYDTSRNTYNVANLFLEPDSAIAETTFTTLDILSNGIKIRSSDSAFNANGSTYIYAAFAENPFKYSIAR